MNHQDVGDAAPLSGIKVIDASNLIAGPMAAMMLADYGADVIKIEHPDSGDSLRSHGRPSNGEPLWWKYLARNKRVVTLNLGKPEARDVFLKLVEDADVLLESFRPGTFDRWGLDYATLSSRNPRLVVAHVTGFGQFGPLSHRPGFGTLGEAMSGFAFRNGQPDGPPSLPPFGLADNVTGLITGFAIMTALWERQTSGRGQEVDVAIIESLLPMLEPQCLEFDQFGTVIERMGSRSPVNAPRNAYRSADGWWIAISGSTLATATRLVQLAGRDDLTREPWFQEASGRAAHVDEIDAALEAWVGSLTKDDVLSRCDEVGAPATPFYSAAEVLEDPQYQALDSIATVPDAVLGSVRMPNVSFRLSRTPGRIRWAGPSMGADNEAVYGELGIDEAGLAKLREQGAV